jgi:hypothetical protein
MNLPYRVRQTLYYTQAGRSTPPVLPEEALALLNEPMLHQFRILHPADQRHLLHVYRYLVVRGASRDTTTAGLIHDVGKGCMKCRITVVDRGLHVLLSHLVPGPYRLFATRESVPGRLRGLHRLASHPARGALAAEQAGYGPVVSRLIRDHEHGGDPEDLELHLLREADEHADAANGWGGAS